MFKKLVAILLMSSVMIGCGKVDVSPTTSQLDNRDVVETPTSTKAVSDVTSSESEKQQRMETWAKGLSVTYEKIEEITDFVALDDTACDKYVFSVTNNGPEPVPSYGIQIIQDNDTGEPFEYLVASGGIGPGETQKLVCSEPLADFIDESKWKHQIIVFNDVDSYSYENYIYVTEYVDKTNVSADVSDKSGKSVSVGFSRDSFLDKRLSIFYVLTFYDKNNNCVGAKSGYEYLTKDCKKSFRPVIYDYPKGAKSYDIDYYTVLKTEYDDNDYDKVASEYGIAYPQEVQLPITVHEKSSK